MLVKQHRENDLINSKVVLLTIHFLYQISENVVYFANASNHICISVLFFFRNAIKMPRKIRREN